MKKKLLGYEGHKLLEDFGIGNPTPGSGSAAALQALISAKLIRTVVILTDKKKRRPIYEEGLPELLRLYSEIENSIYPELEELFQQDSDKFDEYIRLFKEREKEIDPHRKKELNLLVLKQLAIVTECALAIAKLSVKLAKAAAYAFDYGFKDVRGDSAVAFNGAAASVAGCLAIIELNLISFEWDEWVREIRAETNTLKAIHNELCQKAAHCIKVLENENNSKQQHAFEMSLTDLRSGRWEEVSLSDAGIEKLARQMQNILWVYRNLIWKDETPGSHLDVLKPAIAIEKLLGYQFSLASLGRYINDEGKEIEAAGEIDKEKKIVRVSRDMLPAVRNFTAAHELGHAILHKGMVLHRDRPLDGSSANKDIRERQADKFATYFLMPTKQVKNVFQELFQTERFVINENTMFALNEGKIIEFQEKVVDKSGLAVYLAQIEYFQGRVFRSMADIFGVSKSAMAFRLIELELVEY